MEENIENLIEQLTKVRPEMLNEEALKLFNIIMAILDERDELKEENRKLQEAVHKEHTSGYSQGVYDCSEAWKETIKEKMDELEKELTHELTKNDGFAEYREYAIDVLDDIMEDK